MPPYRGPASRRGSSWPGLRQEGAEQGTQQPPPTPSLRHQYKATAASHAFWITVLIGPHAELNKGNKHRTSAILCDRRVLTEFRKQKPEVTTTLFSSLNRAHLITSCFNLLPNRRFLRLLPFLNTEPKKGHWASKE